MFSVDYWYRHSSDTDQSLRATPQMCGSAKSEADALKIIAGLQEQDYTVQRAVIHATCNVCEGNGRIGKAPKGTRKAKAAKLPAWMKTWTECADCNGNGYTHSTDLAVN
jgi:DnaJ-class molecular chaperone